MFKITHCHLPPATCHGPPASIIQSKKKKKNNALKISLPSGPLRNKEKTVSRTCTFSHTTTTTTTAAITQENRRIERCLHSPLFLLSLSLSHSLPHVSSFSRWLFQVVFFSLLAALFVSKNLFSFLFLFLSNFLVLKVLIF
jgi:hypothetical protein